MKIYVKASFDSDALFRIIQQRKSTDIQCDGITLNFQFIGKHTSIDPTLDNSILDFTKQIFNCVNDSITVDKDLFQFILCIYVPEKSNKGPYYLSAWLLSDYVSGTHKRTRFGGNTESNPYIELAISDPNTHKKLLEFSQQVKDYCNDLYKISNKCNILLDKYPGITEDIIRAAHYLSHWIVKENLTTMESIADRTINNRRSSYYGVKYLEDNLKRLFDYAEQHNYSYEDLKALCKDSTFLSTRLKSLGAI